MTNKIKVLHTADIHLQALDDSRWRALQLLISLAKKERVDIFAISGDLFDSESAGDELILPLRKLLTGNSFHTLIIPGNHYKAFFQPGFYPGGDATFLSNSDWKANVHQVGETCFIGIPYEEISSKDFLIKLQSLKDWLPDDSHNLLLFHGELTDKFFSRDAFGEEGQGRYMPVSLGAFNGLPVNYVLAGHFHTNFDVLELPGGGFFVYPGSPVSITRREIGRRNANLFVVGERPRAHELETEYYADVDVLFDPTIERDPLELIQERMDLESDKAKILLTLRGVITDSEMEFKEKVDDLFCDSVEDLDFQVRDMRGILENPIFVRFMEKLNATDISESVRGEISDLMIRAMVECRP